MTDQIAVGLVRVDDIRFHPHNVRQDLGDLRGLAESIASFGVMQPVVVEKHSGGLRLRAGHRRVAAARIAGLTRIPAVIHAEALDDENWLVHSLQENVMRRQLADAERNRAIEALIKLGCSYAGVAEVFGVGRDTIAKWINPALIKQQKARSNIKTTTLRTFTEAWAYEASQRHVPVDELLAALRRVVEDQAIRNALPGVEAQQEAS